MTANRNRPAEGAAPESAGKRSKRTATRRQNHVPRVQFVASDIRGCVRVDLSRPENGERFDFSEVSRRLFRAIVGIPPGATVQLVVSGDTPDYDLRLPDGVGLVQIVAPDAQTLLRWQASLTRAVTEPPVDVAFEDSAEWTAQRDKWASPERLRRFEGVAETTI